MSQQLLAPERTSTSVTPVPDAPATLLQVIARAAADPACDVAKMQALLDLKQRIDKQNAEMEFNAAFARLQQKLPPIRKSAKGHNNKYAPFDEIQGVIQPYLDEEGFGLSFTSSPGRETGWLRIDALLAHVGGHSKPAAIELPIDKSGSMNAIQGVGSTYSYGQRYTTKALLNLRMVGDDTDGMTYSDFITEDQRSTIINMIAEISSGMTATARVAMESKILGWIPAKSYGDIRAVDYPKVKTALDQKLKKAREGK